MPLPEPFARGLRGAGWLAGLPALGLIWAATTLYAAPEIAGRLRAEGARVVAETAGASGEPWLRLAVRGRDLVARGEAPDVGERETVLSRLAALEAPRRIVSELGLVETASPFVWSVTRTGPAGVALEGSRPVELGRGALKARVVAALAPGTRLEDVARAARGAPQDFPEAAAFLAARLAGLAPGGRAALSDTVLSLSGEALDVPAYDALRTALAAPPEGFSVGRIEVLPPTVSDFRFAVEKVAGGIRLEGFAPSEAFREAAARAAAEAAAGGSVDDRLHTARGLPAGIDPDRLSAFAFRLAGLIQSGAISYADGAVSVTGDAIDGQAIPEAAALMRDGRPAGVKAGPVTLAARPLAPYRVAIRRTAEGVSLTGHLPDAATRERVLAALRPRLFREGIADRTRVADGAPPDLGAALAAAVPMLANLAAGEIAVSDRSVTLTGQSLYREGAERAPEALAAALPPGWSGHAAVAARQPAERRDPDSCRAAFAALTGQAPLRFAPGSALLAPSFYPTLDALAALARSCPSLHVAVSGPADPAQAKPAPAAAGEAAPAPGAKESAEKRPAGKAVAGKPETRKPDSRKPDTKKSDTKKPDAKEAAEEGVDLPRQRAFALVEYLLQAGARPDQIAPGPAAPAGPVVFAPLP